MEKPRHTVLCVDDERNILNSIKRLVRKEDYRVILADSGEAGLELLSQKEVHVVISDQRMPGMSGTEFLSQVKSLYPDIIRIILTGYTEVDSIAAAINEGSVYKFFLKPWNDQNLKLEIRQALEQYDLVKANRRLHEKVIEKNNELKHINENLEVVVKERTQTLEIKNQALQLSQAVLEDLPFPIIGISREMMIVLANRAAQSLEIGGRPVSIGDKLNAYFSESTVERVTQCFTEHSPQRLACEGVHSDHFEMETIPLTGRFQGKGLILTLLPTASSQAA